MASVLFDLTDSGDDDGLPKIGLRVYHWFVKLVSVITGVVGLIFMVKSVYLKGSIDELLASQHLYLNDFAFFQRLNHIINTCIAQGILMVFTGITGIACPTYDGMKLYVFLTILLFIMELAIFSSLLAARSQFQRTWVYIKKFCERCVVPMLDIREVISPAIGIAISFAFSQMITLYVVQRFLKLAVSSNTEDTGIQLSVRITTPDRSHPCSSTPNDASSSCQVGLDVTLSPSPISSPHLTVPSYGRIRRKSMRRTFCELTNSIQIEEPELTTECLKSNISAFRIPEFLVTPPPPGAPPPTPQSARTVHFSLPPSPNTITDRLNHHINKQIFNDDTHAKQTQNE